VRLSIFLVEDNPLIRDSLMMAMQELVSATFVGTAATEAEAVAWLGAHAVDWNLAVVDLFLAQGSGLGVVKACRTRQERQRVVVLTNYPNASVIRKASELGADAIFDKSCDLDAFFDFCGRHLRSLPA
jgi:DNA-binding NarL/FixJ family response regulator